VLGGGSSGASAARQVHVWPEPLSGWPEPTAGCVEDVQLCTVPTLVAGYSSHGPDLLSIQRKRLRGDSRREGDAVNRALAGC
jgi:hypothetical protein